MVYGKKHGLIFPEEAFNKLRPYREELLAMPRPNGLVVRSTWRLVER
jgi:hypothetical protein